LRWIILNAECDGDSNLGKLVPNADQVLQWVVAVWMDMEAQTISNCWVQSGILPASMAAELLAQDRKRGSSSRSTSVTVQQQPEDPARDMRELAELLAVMRYPNDDEAMTPEEFFEVDAQEPTESESSMALIVQEHLSSIPGGDSAEEVDAQGASASSETAD
jgi:hypothetical protein